MRVAPLFEARMFFQLVSISPPKGDTIPRPVTTTRRIAKLLKGQKTNGPPPWAGSRSCQAARTPPGRRGGRSGLVGLDIVDRVLDGADLLGRVVGNLDSELLLEGHDQLDDVEAVGAEIVDEAGFLGDLAFLDPEMLDDDLLHPVGGLAHVAPFPRGVFSFDHALAAVRARRQGARHKRRRARRDGWQRRYVRA